jgi:transposase-like protein
MMQRGGQVVLNLLANVKHKTIEPLIKGTIMPGTLVYTDDYGISARLEVWGYEHKRVNHGRGEFARDDDGDGMCAVHVNTMEGFWSLLRSGRRPHRGISPEKLPLYLGFFEFVPNVRSEVKRCWARSLSYSSHKIPESNKSEIKSSLSEVQPQRRFPINPPPHGLRRLAVGEMLRKLHDRHQG